MSRLGVESSIIDRIYETAFLPELWVDVLDRIALLARCDGGFLFSVDAQQRVRAVTSERYGPLLDAYVAGGWGARNIRAPRLANMNYPGFVVDYDVVTPHEAATDPFYDYLRKYGGGWGTGTIIPMPTGDLVVFDIERSGDKGPLDRSVLTSLDQLRPHLARSALMSVRLGLEQARAMSEALGKIGLPGAVLRDDGTVLSTNSLMEALDKQFIPLARGRLGMSHRPAHDLFHAAVAEFTWNGSGVHSCSIPIPAIDNSPACVVHLIPVRRRARDIFSGAAILLAVTSLAKPDTPPAHVLNGLFDLTPAEANVARQLVGRHSVGEIAATNCVSRETIRRQLKSVLEKTGTKRQAELVGLLTGVQLPRGTSP
ncbi:hypothetical protein NKI20_29745 [Mesorhizobium sp. M0830]|uniref:helix-turn-helix transcriptional regulator n=1 Tax=Mesorhizobium sp. M0830 TaxID=2957008 RepID=UPI00333B2E7C